MSSQQLSSQPVLPVQPAKSNKILKIILAIESLLLALVLTIISLIIYDQYGYMHISCTDSFELNEYLEEIEQLPESIEKSFILNKWAVSIEEEKFIEHEEQTNRTSIGLTNSGAKKIWLKETTATLHEFGHYLQSVLNEDYNKRIKECYEKEGKQYFDNRNLSNKIRIRIDDNRDQLTVWFMGDIMLGYMLTPLNTQPLEVKDAVYNQYLENYYHEYPLDDSIEINYPELGTYATISDEEYFAQYFKYWLKNRDSISKMEILRDKTPETYKLFIELENNNWCIETSTFKVIAKNTIDYINSLFKK